MSEHISEIIVAIIVSFQVIITAWLKSSNDKNFKKFIDKNNDDHSTIFDNLTKLVNYYNLNVSKEEMIKQMHHNKDFFCSQFKNENLRNFVIYRANEFITIVTHIVEMYTIEIANANEIQHAFHMQVSSVKAEMMNRYDENFVNNYYETQHQKLIDKYFKEMQKIIIDLENHHRDRFLRLANQYLIDSIEEIQSYDEVAGLYEK